MNATNIYSTPASSPIQPISNIYSSLFTLQNDSYTASNFNYAIKLYSVALGVSNSISGSSFISELFVPPRPIYGRGLFSPAQYLQSYLYNPDTYINSVYTTSTFENGPFSNYQFGYGLSWNPELQIAAILQVGVGATTSNIGFTFSQPHGLTAGDIIFVSANDTVISGEQTILSIGLTNTRFVIDRIWATPSVSTGYITSAKRYNGTSSVYSVWNGTNQYETRTVNYDYLIAGNFNTAPAGQMQKFLSNYYSKDYWSDITIDFGDAVPKTANLWETIGFWADPVDLFNNTGGNLFLNYEVFSATGSLMASLQLDVNNDANYIRNRWEVGVGYNNVGGLGLLSAGGEKYWDVFFTDSSTASSVISERRRYIIDEECTQYQPVLVAWINRLGSLDYYTFTQNSRETLNISRNEWKKELGLDPFYQQVDRGRGVISQTVKQTITMNSNWIDEEEYAWLNELISSPYVWVFKKNTEGDLIPFPTIVIDSSYEFKKKLTEQIFNLSITLDFANDVWSVNQNQ